MFELLYIKKLNFRSTLTLSCNQKNVSNSFGWFEMFNIVKLYIIINTKVRMANLLRFL